MCPHERCGIVNNKNDACNNTLKVKNVCIQQTHLYICIRKPFSLQPNQQVTKHFMDILSNKVIKLYYNDYVVAKY